MSIITHGLASLALVRAAWPRAPKQMWLVALAAGIIADVDAASAWWSAAAYLKWHGTFTHSLLIALVFAILCTVLYAFLATEKLRTKFSVASFFSLVLSILCLHLLMDLCAWEGVALLWPFAGHKFSLDWVVNLDPCIIAILLGALAFPELLHLISAEIGERETKPRGRIGARIGFALIVAYLAVRAEFHSNVLALVDARTFRGEIARRVAAFPETFSLLEWHGIAETARGLHLMTVNVGPAGSFDPESADTFFKPDPSAALETAQRTPLAQTFLQSARFPKATVETVAEGTRVELRDLTREAAGESGREAAALIRLDATGRVVSQEILWVAALAQE